MKIGFLGIQCDNPNLGVSALAYAGINLVHQLAGPEAEFVLFSENSEQGLDRMSEALMLGTRRLRAVPFRHRSPRRLLGVFREMGSCDLIIDFTGGDSFSDIYGLPRLLKSLLHKEMSLLSGTPLILAPQTYGPFKNRAVLVWVRHVLERAALIFSRDLISEEFLKQNTSREVILTTDVAVTLPWAPEPCDSAGSSRRRVGFNVSGLLWQGGYSQDNQFNLRVDYRAYCRGVVEALQESGYEVALMAHVLPNERGDGEGELAACQELHSGLPGTSLAPVFRTPVEAKTWIAGMDLFIGARMHATIAAFTTGVPTIPVAYSRKFAGLFGSLGYDVVVDLAVLGTAEAIEMTLCYASQADLLRPEVQRGLEEARARIRVFPERLENLTDGLCRRPRGE